MAGAKESGIAELVAQAKKHVADQLAAHKVANSFTAKDGAPKYAVPDAYVEKLVRNWLGNNMDALKEAFLAEVKG